MNRNNALLSKLNLPVFKYKFLTLNRFQPSLTSIQTLLNYEKSTVHISIATTFNDSTDQRRTHPRKCYAHRKF